MAKGPGRLSSLKLLPAEAREDVQWALGEVAANNRTQADILFELNDRLCAKGLEEFTISRSAFNRAAVKHWLVEQRNKETASLLEVFNAKKTPAERADTNIATIEMMKIAYAEIASRGDEFSTKQLLELSRGYLALLQSEKMSDEQRAKAVAEFKTQAGEALDAVAKAKGLTQQVADDLKAKILGIEKKAA